MTSGLSPLFDITTSRTLDRLAIAEGILASTLMERAGEAAARIITARFASCRVLVLCGPGNNGGDGWVIAHHLHHHGFHVRVASLVAKERLHGEAALMAKRWTGETLFLEEQLPLHDTDLVIDALFGTGLSRPLPDMLLKIAARLRASHLPVIAIDIPSGIQGDSGAILGDALSATLTITFSSKKPGHVLWPGKEFCGEILVADIGIPASLMTATAPIAYENTPGLWHDHVPHLNQDTHKYQRGTALISGGNPIMAGASKLAAMAALRAGAGLSMLLVPALALPVYAASLLSLMVRPVDQAEQLSPFLIDPRPKALLVGPGNGIESRTLSITLAALHSSLPCVLDADALTCLSNNNTSIFPIQKTNVILTPHEGEWSRLFTFTGNKLIRAQASAKASGCIIVLKGTDTIIAHPNGRTAIHHDAPPWLATAGSGDVLAGIITGLLAQGMPAFEAACMGVWLHGRAAKEHGRGMISEDLLGSIPAAYRALAEETPG